MNSEQKVKQRPILFSTPMVQGILEDRKMVTRRMVKPQPWLRDENHVIDNSLTWGWCVKEKQTNQHGETVYEVKEQFKCPYGTVGDILWVRETWLYNDSISEPYAFKADYNEEYQKQMKGYWKPSIFMPREACRLFLQITEIRAERLQDITDEEAEKEGVLVSDEGFECWDYIKREWGDFGFSPAESFQTLWESINGPGSWNANPWVWCVSFKRIDKPE